MRYPRPAGDPLRAGRASETLTGMPASSIEARGSISQKPSRTFVLRSGEVETVEMHDFVPHRYEVLQELLLGVLTSIDFRQGPELGVRAEN